jgi:hypothetical protein
MLPSTSISTTKILSLTAVGTIALYLGKVWYSYNFFKNRGLPNPPYEFFFGNFREIRKEKKLSKVIRKWTEQYGKTFGYFFALFDSFKPLFASLYQYIAHFI